MTDKKDMEQKLVCSFCNKTQNEVHKLIAGKSIPGPDGKQETVLFVMNVLSCVPTLLKGKTNQQPLAETIKMPQTISC